MITPRTCKDDYVQGVNGIMYNLRVGEVFLLGGKRANGSIPPYQGTAKWQK